MARSPATKIASFAASSAALILSLPPPGEAHPLCLYGPDRAVSTTAEATFCPDVLAEGFCCEPNEEAVLSEKYAAIEGALSAECAPLYKEVLCGVCSPYSAHLYTRLAEMGDDGLAMTRDFCDGFVMACGADLALDATYCDEHVLDYSDENAAREYWSYPLDITAGFNGASVTAAFPDLPEETLPPEPITMQMTPDGSAWWIGGMTGYIKMVASQDPTDAIDVLDISDRAEFSYEQGLLGFAFSPSFTETGLFYVSYTVAGVMNPENGLNRLSKFVYYAGDVVTTSGSEEILLTSTEKGSSVHSSGWVGFAPSSYVDPEGAYHDIYWTVGDGGPQNDPDNKAQDMTKLHGSIVRISVPSTAMGTGYEIPAGNPFDGANGEKAEICAWGLRNPHRCAFDTATDELYCGDVGQDRVEEVNVIECGKDYGWRMFEGSRCNDGFEGYDDGECSGLDRADYAFPVFEYCHFDYDSSQEEFDACGDRTVTGLSVIGGHVYRGAKYDDILGGHYIFADHSVGSLHHLAPAAGGGWTAGTILSSIPKIGSFAEGNDGELYMVGYEGNIYDLPCGDLCESVEEQEEASSACLPQSDNTPTFEEIGCFLDGQPKTMTLSTAPGCDGTMNAEMCASFCATVEGATHFGLQYQRECYCGGEGDDYAQYGDQLDDAECDMPCSGFPTQMCGGRSKMNVFAITGEGAPSEDAAATPVSTASPSTDTETTPPPTDVPATDATSTAAPTTTTTTTTTTSGASSFSETYMGCYGDDKGARALTFAYTASETMSLEECESFCSTAGASIFALEHGRQCSCGTDETDFEAYGPAVCDTPCAGSPDTVCGGYDAMSVYNIEPEAATTPTASPTTASPIYSDDKPETSSSASSEKEVYPDYIPSSVSTEPIFSEMRPSSAHYYSSGGEPSYDATVGSHLGCYLDVRHDRLLRSDMTESEDMTPAVCGAFCGEGGSEVFSLKYGTECWCGDLASFSGAVEADDEALCDYECAGDDTLRCGGYLYADVYRIEAK